jgi:hypothetical protein
VDVQDADQVGNGDAQVLAGLPHQVGDRFVARLESLPDKIPID